MFNPFRLFFGKSQGFEAGGMGRRVQEFAPARHHVNALIRASGATLTARARYLDYNDGYGGHAADLWQTMVVGDGIKPRPNLDNQKDREHWLNEWQLWNEVADADGLLDFYGLQSLIAREAFVAGECFVRFRSRRPGDMTAMPFQLQVYQSEMLDTSFDEVQSGGRFIKAGIEFNALGQRLAYHFFPQHPGDQRPGTVTGLKRVRVPASDVLHVMDPKCAGQIRGVSRYAKAIMPLHMLRSYDDNEMDRKRVAAAFALAITQNDQRDGWSDDEDNDEAPEPSTRPDDDDELLDPLKTGTVVKLNEGEDVKAISTADVGGSYEAWQYRQLLRISAALGLPYSYLSADPSRGNFSNVRTDIVRFRRQVKSWTCTVLMPQLCRPVVERFHTVGLLSGRLLPAHVPPRVKYLPPRQEWVDPAKDVSAVEKELKLKLKSRTEALAERGLDIEDVDRELERESTDFWADNEA
ncbi:phage portal protein, lambda family [Roseibium sp. TrichSKD4]|uniref:phage portal protein n=1 Tax=Roseibium sp. TrichSKD4 TaxID=744980 RepID=UPI0001E56F55|nr:phage portal protein [Roseibium sp. TrichSKD4]EFO31344.1 phage portal protein, lambda family [Roseibium sp. TrichSKD4]